MNELTKLLQKHRHSFSRVVPLDLRNDRVLALDLSVDNTELCALDDLSTPVLSAYILRELQERQVETAIGGYGEDRIIYRKSEHFGTEGEDARSIHLGLDIWCPPGTAVCAPLDSKVHSFQNNTNFGDYGPTVILEHKLEDQGFYTLYGHLSASSLLQLHTGQFIPKGSEFAQIGHEKENGEWPPHLHLQVITNLEGRSGDFPGVSSRKEMDHYLNNCPDPQLLLNHS